MRNRLDGSTRPVTLLIFNKTEEYARVNLIRHTGDETIQYMSDYLGEEPSQEHTPSWAISIPGVYKYIRAGDSYTWKGILEPGINTMACTKTNPYGTWLGGGFTVED